MAASYFMDIFYLHMELFVSFFTFITITFKLIDNEQGSLQIVDTSHQSADMSEYSNASPLLGSSCSCSEISSVH